ncbi:MAG: hypothetical protein ACU0DX_01740 [Roseovarius sp.]|uniref:hypothetical protein n=1 Tax=Roseovarius sp. TaxID=1486281 RepID=UPI004059CF91
MSNPKTDLSQHFSFASTYFRLASQLLACLAISGGDAWSEFTQEVQALLLDFERYALAEAALRALPINDALAVSLEVIGAAGRPMPACLGGMSTARNWAQAATRAELKAYALASFEAMPPGDQAAFLNHVQAHEKDQAA